jgi:predicted anti-sigma-YlaC factor YlaD
MRLLERSRHRPEMGCEHARLEISARADGERMGQTATLEAHLRTCVACRRFDLACRGVRPELVELGRHLGLRPAQVAPAELVELLVASRTAGHSRRLARPGRAWRRPLSWATAAAPLGAVAVALPLALAHPPALAPSHVPSPCTLELTVHHGLESH